MIRSEKETNTLKNFQQVSKLVVDNVRMKSRNLRMKFDPCSTVNSQNALNFEEK